MRETRSACGIEGFGGELVDAVDENGETILHLAVRSNQLEVIVLLFFCLMIYQNFRL